jgi:hypothetical protein
VAAVTHRNALLVARLAQPCTTFQKTQTKRTLSVLPALTDPDGVLAHVGAVGLKGHKLGPVLLVVSVVRSVTKPKSKRLSATHKTPPTLVPTHGNFFDCPQRQIHLEEPSSGSGMPTGPSKVALMMGPHSALAAVAAAEEEVAEVAFLRAGPVREISHAATPTADAKAAPTRTSLNDICGREEMSGGANGGFHAQGKRRKQKQGCETACCMHAVPRATQYVARQTLSQVPEFTLHCAR